MIAQVLTIFESHTLLTILIYKFIFNLNINFRVAVTIDLAFLMFLLYS